ncbi:hypothetical protein D3C85_1829280 [compost metagenome]
MNAEFELRILLFDMADKLRNKISSCNRECADSDTAGFHSFFAGDFLIDLIIPLKNLPEDPYDSFSNRREGNA